MKTLNVSLSRPAIGYRAGELESPRGIFFADSYDAAWLYAIHAGKPVIAYSLTVKNVWEMENQYQWYADSHGKTYDEVRAMPKSKHWLREIDAEILKAAVRQGYDAVLYTRPTTPNANWELMVVKAASCKYLGECDDKGNYR